MIGRVVKPHGIRGEVVVEPLTDVAGRFEEGSLVRVGELETTVTRSRLHQGRLLVALERVEGRDAAEALRGAEVSGPALDEEQFPTYFAHELMGCEVVHGEDEQHLGTVVGLRELPAAAGYELLEVERDQGDTLLIPAVDELVVAREDEAADGGLYLALPDPPEGLLD